MLTRSNQYCTNCGLVSADIDKADVIMNHYRMIDDFPMGYLLDRPLSDFGTGAPFFTALGSMIARSATNAEFFNMSGRVGANINPSGLVDCSLFSMATSSIRMFRVMHPHVRFFRCWNCDLNSEAEPSPLLPPEKYAHSTLANELLEGRPGWHDWSIHDQIEEEISKLDKKMYGVAPIGDFLSGRTSQGREWAKEAYERMRSEIHESNSSIESAIAKLRQKQSSFPERPDARDHHPCPECGISFPLILRSENDRRYSVRNETNYNKPLNKMEERLIIAPSTGVAPQSIGQFAHQLLDYCVDEGACLPSLIQVQSLEEMAWLRGDLWRWGRGSEQYWRILINEIIARTTIPIPESDPEFVFNACSIAKLSKMMSHLVWHLSSTHLTTVLDGSYEKCFSLYEYWQKATIARNKGESFESIWHLFNKKQDWDRLMRSTAGTALKMIDAKRSSLEKLILSPDSEEFMRQCRSSQ